MAITWKTRNLRSLFSLKNKSDYKSCVVCSSRYIGETKRTLPSLIVEVGGKGGLLNREVGILLQIYRLGGGGGDNK